MPQVQSIRRLRRNGESVASIARKTHVSEPTVRKYLAKEDLSAVPSVRKPRASVIDPYLPVIEQWLAEDRANWRKQRHTATRIWERLRDEHGAEVSLSTVTRAVARLRREFADQNSINMNPATRHNTPMISVRSRDHRSNSTDVGSSLADSLTSNTTLTMEISSTDRPTS